LEELSLTAAVITFNSEVYIEDCLNSILASGLQESDIVVVDDGSSDTTADIVTSRFPNIRFLTGEKNFGHSHACNRAIMASQSNWVVLIDHDTVVHLDWLTQLSLALQEHAEAGIVVSRAVFDNDRETIHSDGGFAHYFGAMIIKNGFRRISELDVSPAESKEIGAAGTTSMAVKKQVAIEAGLFDEDFFIYLNDFEFSIRVRALGYKLFCAPLSIIYHKGGTQDFSYRGSGSYPSTRGYFIIRNRWFLMLKLYRLKTMILCAPMILLYELAILLMAVKKGLFREYVRAFSWVVTHVSLIYASRKKFQNIRKVEDAGLLSAGSLTFVPGVVSGAVMQWAKQTLDSLANRYWAFVEKYLDRQ
jgi:GT2 family glycosyltransferase